MGTTANAGRGGNRATGGEANDTVRTDSAVAAIPETSVVDEVIWVVGDEPILKSDVEMMRLQAEAEGISWSGDPDCSIPAPLAVQQLFLHQAAIDSVEVSESEIASGIDRQIDAWIQYAGSKEKLEEYRQMSISQMRQQLREDSKNNYLIQEMKKKLVEDINAILVLCNGRICPWIVNGYVDIVLLEGTIDVDDLGVANVRTVLLEGEAEDDDL